MKAKAAALHCTASKRKSRSSRSSAEAKARASGWYATAASTTSGSHLCASGARSNTAASARTRSRISRRACCHSGTGGPSAPRPPFRAAGGGRSYHQRVPLRRQFQVHGPPVWPTCVQVPSRQLQGTIRTVPSTKSPAPRNLHVEVPSSTACAQRQHHWQVTIIHRLSRKSTMPESLNATLSSTKHLPSEPSISMVRLTSFPVL
mmetsp:Transcript_101155/g.321224  ORF Transcript_101155/g.321224 Transcript_101155/m.321224 type:complete len:204 (-) Transcript_101155:708-1319(-)